MKRVIIDKNIDIKYSLIGNIYYPFINSGVLHIGKFGKEREKYLKENYPSVYLPLTKVPKYLNRVLFEFDSMCYQLRQLYIERWIRFHPEYNKKDFNKAIKDIDEMILTIYVNWRVVK